MPIRQEFRKELTEFVRELEIYGTSRRTALPTIHAADSESLAHIWWLEVLRGKQPRTCKASGEIRTIDLFSSIGGLSLGFGFGAQALGFEHRSLLAVDIDEGALSVYSNNFPDALPLAESINELADVKVNGRGAGAKFAYTPELMHPQVVDLVDKVDVLLAGPPCQGHSTLNNRTRHEDPRNRLYLEAIGTAVALNAPLMVIENVPTVRSDREQVIATATSVLNHAGYEVDERVISGEKIGAAQSRKRHFLVASKYAAPSIDAVVQAIAAPPMTLLQAIGDLEFVDQSFLDEPPQLSQDNIRRIDYLFETEQHELPNEQRPDCHKDGHTYPSVYGRLYWDRPSPTITTGFTTPGRGRFIHPSQRRTLTAHEAARIQGFPDTFDFSLPDKEIPSRKQLTKWIGDAVPSQLGYAATLSALATLPKTRFNGSK